MNSLDDIWQSIIDKLSQTLTPTAINTWFSDCQPVELGAKRLVIATSTDFKRNIIAQRFEPSILQALSDLFSCDFELTILVGDEVLDYQREDVTNDTLPEARDYTFDRFIVGSSNKFAHAAAVAVAENPGATYNPLFIYGRSGLGKTHLLLAIGQAIREKNPSAKMGYVKGDDFTNQLVKSIRDNTQEEFRLLYRKLDLFLVDDIQFIAGKDSTQEEFFHTFNSIYEAGGQIVITSDRPPVEMVKLEERLRTRFEGGLMADIQPPDLETRIAIIRNKSQRLGLVLPDDVVNYIAEAITANIRQIEGVVHQLTANQNLSNKTISVETAKEAIDKVTRTGIYIPTPEDIIRETGRFFGISEDEIRGQRRSKNTAMARQVAMYLIRTLTHLPLVDIGEQFDHRNHSTVLSSTRKVEELLKSDPSMSDTIRDITANINSLHDR